MPLTTSILEVMSFDPSTSCHCTATSDIGTPCRIASCTTSMSKAHLTPHTETTEEEIGAQNGGMRSRKTVHGMQEHMRHAGLTAGLCASPLQVKGPKKGFGGAAGEQLEPALRVVDLAAAEHRHAQVHALHQHLGAVHGGVSNEQASSCDQWPPTDRPHRAVERSLGG